MNATRTTAITTTNAIRMQLGRVLGVRKYFCTKREHTGVAGCVAIKLQERLMSRHTRPVGAGVKEQDEGDTW